MAILICLALFCGSFAIKYLFYDLAGKGGIDKTEKEKFFIFFTASYDEKPIRYVIGRVMRFTLSSAFFFIFWSMAVTGTDTGLSNISYFPIFCGSVVVYFFALIANLKDFKKFDPKDKIK